MCPPCGWNARCATSTTSIQWVCPTLAGVARSRRLALQALENREGLPVLTRGRLRLAPNSGRPGARGHHRARPLPVHCNGETVARLEERLGYVHKGVEALCAGAPLGRAGKIAARISGDSTVAYSFAFARGCRGSARLGRAAPCDPLARHHGRAGAPFAPRERRGGHLQRRQRRGHSRPLRTHSRGYTQHGVRVVSGIG